jgi:HAD superfamily hydrolase (TIGR01509 family)
VAAPDLVIFDCDGVLVDSERLAIRLDVEMLGELGWTLTEADVVERFMGRSEADFVREVEAHLGHPLPAGWDESWTALYHETLRAELEPVDGVVEALDALTVPTCVASSGSHEKLRLTLGITGLYDRFAGRIFSAHDVARGKPEPDLFLHAAGTLDADPARCVVVEDSRFGVRAARAAGMRVLGYAGGLTPSALLSREGAEVFADMRELPRLLAA